MSLTSVEDLFAGRKLVIATKHHKEKVIAPLFKEAFGLDCFTLENFDTDLLGMFTGEIERRDDPIVTLRNKCLQAMELSHCDLGIASEGSFGSHPGIPYVHADDEFLIFIDKKNDLEIIERELSVTTNFNGTELGTVKELIEFANHVKFPTHALIVQKAPDDTSEIVKGITTWDLLTESFQTIKEKYGAAYVTTDMRALYNPTRMGIIKIAAEKLVRKIKSYCPCCQTPGFGITDAKRGLPCELCGLPTRSVKSYIYVCRKCSLSKEEKFPLQKKHEDPMFCDFCNP